MTEKEIKVYWYYFRSLSKQLQDTEQFVDHAIDAKGTMANSSTFSNEFAKILMLSASEFEVIAKELCRESGKQLPWNANIIRITRELVSTYPRIGETTISTPYQTLQPLQNWKIIQVPNKNGNLVDKVIGIQWWDDHNEIKHNRSSSFASAHLKNCIEAMASLMVLELYLSQKALGDVNAITSLGCSYFECDYGLSHLVVNAGNKLPDF